MVVSSNPVQDEVYSMQHYVIKFVSDLRQVGGFVNRLVCGKCIDNGNRHVRNNSSRVDLW
jgi:hypothetical protein